MLRRLSDAGLIWPTILAIVGLFVLAGLGTWQWQRMHWKDGLLAQIAERTTAPPVALDAALAAAPADGPPEYTRVSVSGRFDYAHERHVYANSDQGPGWHLFTPLVRQDPAHAGAQDAAHDVPKPVVWVNRGFVPAPYKRPQDRADTYSPDGPVTITGLVRHPGEPGTFTPDNDPAANIWYWRDLAGMHRSAFGQDRPPAPVFVDAEADPATADRWPRAGTPELKLHNKHLGYALTGWGLALTLIGVFVAFAAQRLRGGR